MALEPQPVLIWFVDQLHVHLIFFGCLIEGILENSKAQKHDTEREDVNILSLIRPSGKHLRSLIPRCTQHRAQIAVLLLTLEVDAKAQINDFDCEVVLYDDVFGLNVTVSDSRRMQLVNCIHDLYEHKP